MSDTDAALISKLAGLSGEAVLAVYADLLGDEELQHGATLPAQVLRDKARAGELDANFVPMMTIALVDAPNLAAFIHLAKGLAAFGRAAQNASPYIIERLEQVQVTTDRRFWVLDSGLWVLGYLGGATARTFVAGLKTEEPARVMRSKSVYEGELKHSARAARFVETLDKVLALIDGDDPGGWREKRTDLGAVANQAAPQKLSPWMTR